MKHTSIALFYLFSLFLFSCTQRKDRTEDVKTIEQQLTAVDEAEKVFHNTDFSSTIAINKTVMDDIHFIQQNYKDTMSKEEAMFLTHYKNVAKLVKNLEKKQKKTELEIQHTKDQLNNLKSAMMEHATEDKKGNEINDDYLDNALKEETLYSKQLINQITHMKDNCGIVKEKYPEMKPRIDSLIASLQLKMNTK